MRVCMCVHHVCVSIVGRVPMCVLVRACCGRVVACVDAAVWAVSVCRRRVSVCLLVCHPRVVCAVFSVFCVWFASRWCCRVVIGCDIGSVCQCVCVCVCVCVCMTVCVRVLVLDACGRRGCASRAFGGCESGS